jgi:ABC-type Fe3+ transport system substrate-binding protein
MSGGSGDALRFFYHSKLLGPEFLKKLLTEMDVTMSADSRQMADWMAAGKFAFTIFSPISRMDLDVGKEQGLPVDWFQHEQLKEGAYITAGSGGVALMNRAPHPNAAKVAINWLLSREGQMTYQRLFAQGEDGPDSMRIDIPKDKVPKRNRRPHGDESKFPLMDRAELMDMEPIRKFVRELMEQRKK